MPFHTIQQGETLLGLAAANGLKDWNAILDAPENAALKKTRTDPGILKEGDSVFIPNKIMRHEASATDAKHTFNVAPPKAWIRLALKDASGAALAGKKYTLVVDGKATSGTIGPGGIIEQSVAVDAARGALTVTIDATTAETWDLCIGYMDPLDEDSGVAARLRNLGFDFGDDAAAAVRAFQARVGLDVTGAIDDALRAKLKAYYDPAQSETDLDKAAT